MNKEKKIIPELRFPEFVNDGQWEVKKLEDICEVNPKVCELPDEFIYIDLESVSNGILLKKNSINKANAPSRAQRVLRNRDVIYQMVRPYQKNNFYFIRSDDYNYVASTGYAQLRAFESSNFLFQLIHIDSFVSSVLDKCTGSNYPAINSSALKQIDVQIPSKKTEQQKIAACLSSLDELIEAHNQKLEALKDHKKGLMQNLFPQEGEKVPKHRFPEFENDGEWKFDSFCNIYSFLVTNSFSRDKLNYTQGKVKNIHYGDIHTKFSTLFDIRKEVVPFINQDIPLNRIKPENYCQVGDIVFADASEDMDDVGKNIEIINLNGAKVLSGLHTLLARQKSSKIAIGFGGYLFKSPSIRKLIQREAQGAKVLGISGTRLSEISICFPKNKKEQQKIVSTLSAIDELIKEQLEKIEQLKSHKKGLMQGLFPNPEN
ncbi:restriction endonuclease subunit S [Sunxiuqinia elliptica]